MEGTEICRRLRADGDWTPVIFLTARDDEVDRILGLELGGDDYVTKPFSPRELVARVQVAAAPRGRAGRRRAGCARSGRCSLDPARRLVTVDGAPLTLTPTEFDLLAHLLRPAGAGVHPGGAAGLGLGVRVARRHPYRRRARGPGAGQARRRGRA